VETLYYDLATVLTGFLAGIYPIGMKIAADYFNKGLGNPWFFGRRLGIELPFPHF
jgi:hypothetical protein